jgi:endonuclease/exonuclease/phosphatase family metal-dependent hydrolase
MKMCTPPLSKRATRLSIARLLPTLLVALPALLWSVGCSASPAEAEPAIRTVSWNIRWYPGESPQATPEEVAEHREEVLAYLPDLNPDILLLQEIRDQEAAAELVAAVPGLELHVATQLKRPELPQSQQLVIASRYPAVAAYAEVFTNIYQDADATPYRGFAFAALENPLGGLLLTYSVHLKSNRGELDTVIAIREEQARQLLSHIEAMQAEFADRGPLAILVGGDFNVLLEQPERAHEQTLQYFIDRGFHWTWDGVPFEERGTWPGRGNYGAACFDHIVTLNLPVHTAELMYKPRFQLSDHVPVLLSIPLPEETNTVAAPE